MTSFVRAPPVTAHRAVNCIISWAPAPSKGQKSCHASPWVDRHPQLRRRRRVVCAMHPGFLKVHAYADDGSVLPPAGAPVWAIWMPRRHSFPAMEWLDADS
jgi:hypothetical protein